MSANLPAGPETSSAPTHPPPNPIKSTAPLLTTTPPTPSPTFNTLLVIPFSSSLTRFALPDGKGGQKPGGQGRAEAEGEVREEYRRLMDVLVRSGELKVTSRRGTKGDEVWIFVGASEKKIAELAARERREDFLHSVSSTTRPSSFDATLPASERIRLIYELITANTLQGGLGITPGEGNWRRVEGVMALQDEKANHAWVQSWLGKQWYIGLTSHMTHAEQSVILDNYGPSVALYFSFLNFYAGALVPLTAVGTVFWLGSKGIFAKLATMIGLETWAYTGGLPEAGYGWGWSWLYAFIVGIWGIAVVEMWRIKERKLSVSYGTHRVQTVARLRPQYLSSIASASGFSAPATTATQAISASNAPTDTTFIMRELKIFASVPVLVALGVLLGGLLTGIFVFEAFLAKLYDGAGKSLLGLVPTLIFVGVIPNVLAMYHSISNKLTHWENHPTKAGHESSLTVKTFALNSIVAYLGLFLSAFVYVPFGELIMSYFSSTLTHKQNKVGSLSAEQTGLGPKTTVAKRAGVKSDRLGGQVFAYTVTNQAINAFTELGLPYIKQFIQDKRNDKKDRDAGKKTGYEMRDVNVNPEEKKFMKKVERELGLIEYSNFTDYAEMVTQFGYITVWSVVWPLAPLFALINNWVELRGDAIKISTQVRRPIGERVENIGPWLTMMSFITWMAFVTSSTLCYLFRPNLDYPAHAQSINPNYNSTTYSNYGSAFLHAALENSIHDNPNRTIAEGTAYLPNWVANSHVIRSVLPMAIPSLFVALLASHGYLIVRLTARWAAEKLLWQGSEEARALEMSEEAVKRNFLEGRFDDGLGQMGGHRDAHLSIGEGAEFHPAWFWRGTDEGDAVIAQTLKSE